MQKLKLLEPNLEGLEIYNSSFLDSQIFLPNYKIPQLYDLIHYKIPQLLDLIQNFTN